MFVYPGDITYLVLDDLPEDDSNGDAIVSEDIQLAQPNWRESLLASYLVAATTSTMVSASDAPEQDTSLLPSPSEGSEERPEQ
jgi:hypothetical protein